MHFNVIVCKYDSWFDTIALLLTHLNVIITCLIQLDVDYVYFRALLTLIGRIILSTERTHTRVILENSLYPNVYLATLKNM